MRILDSTHALTAALREAYRRFVTDSVGRMQNAEREALARLERYVPTEPLLDSKQAAAYLRIPLRTLHMMTCPGNIVLPFNWLNNKKRFRKVQLDAWLLRNEVKAKEIKL